MRWVSCGTPWRDFTKCHKEARAQVSSRLYVRRNPNRAHISRQSRDRQENEQGAKSGKDSFKTASQTHRGLSARQR